MTDFLSSMLEPTSFVVGAALVIALLATVLAAIAWGLLAVERRRHRDAEARAAQLDEATTSIQRDIGLPLREIEDSLRFAEGQTDDIVATVTAFQRLYAASRDFTVTPELLFELKDLTKSVDSRELIVELPDRVRQALKQVSMMTAIMNPGQNDPARSEARPAAAGSTAAEVRDDQALPVGSALAKTRAS